MDLDMNVSHTFQCDKCKFSAPHERNLVEHTWRVHPAVRESSRRQSKKRPSSPSGAAPSSVSKKIRQTIPNYHSSRYV